MERRIIMGIYNRKFWMKLFLLLLASVIGIGSLYYTNILVEELKIEEQKKIEIWAEATKQLGSSDMTDKNFDFLLKVIQNNQTVPVILTDSADNIISYRNFDSIKSLDTSYLKAQLKMIKLKNERIVIDIGKQNKNYIYYKDSYILQQLSVYPYIQLGVILIFILVAYFAFSSSRKAEQNQVWVGLTKETAHQLGTPLSSLMAWYELLKEETPENPHVQEMFKDIKRLESITERFSKIGSNSPLQKENLCNAVENTVNYLRSRVSKNVTIDIDCSDRDIEVPLIRSLFEWVIENLCKNAVDAMAGSGSIQIVIVEKKNKIQIDVIDSGKGIQKSKFKTIFKPGYTTKKRGWGLGLSLVKRIVEKYHRGKIFVYNSQIGKGTDIRILLPKIKK